MNVMNMRVFSNEDIGLAIEKTRGIIVGSDNPIAHVHRTYTAAEVLMSVVAQRDAAAVEVARLRGLHAMTRPRPVAVSPTNPGETP